MTWPPLKNLQQPWIFVYYAVGFGGLTYLVQGKSVGTAVFGGLLFALLMSLWRGGRQRRLRKGLPNRV